MELRSPDPSCNPYLAFALIIAAGIEGMTSRLPLMPSIDEGGPGAPLPMTLKDALDAMAADPLVAKVLGEETTRHYLSIKNKEWDQYIATVHPWETEKYFIEY